ncbi:MAG: plastocyanin/azurin family copper-binding protein [Haloglomus sp.]
MRRRAFLAGAGAATAALAGCLGPGRSTDAEYDVGMSTSRFRPTEYAVAPGTTVRWYNTSQSSHTVTAYADGIPAEAAYFASGGHDSEAAAREAWNSSRGGSLAPGDSYEHTFEVPGTYEYFCIPHEPAGMIGVVEVTEDATRTPR